MDIDILNDWVEVEKNDLLAWLKNDAPEYLRDGWNNGIKFNKKENNETFAVMLDNDKCYLCPKNKSLINGK